MFASISCLVVHTRRREVFKVSKILEFSNSDDSMQERITQGNIRLLIQTVVHATVKQSVSKEGKCSHRRQNIRRCDKIRPWDIHLCPYKSFWRKIRRPKDIQLRISYRRRPKDVVFRPLSPHVDSCAPRGSAFQCSRDRFTLSHTSKLRGCPVKEKEMWQNNEKAKNLCLPDFLQRSC